MNKKVQQIGIYLLKILALAIIYHLSARLGLMMAYVQPNTSPVWPASGVAIAALLLFGINLWPGVFLGVVGGSVLNNVPVTLALGMGVGNTLEAFVVVYCLSRLVDFHVELNRVQDVLYLLGFSCLGTLISATIGVMTLMLTGIGPWEFFFTILITWWIGNLLGAMVVAPVIMVWSTQPNIETNRRAYLEGSILLVMLGIFTWYVFSNTPPDGITHQALLYFIFPIAIWAALRFGQRGATTAIFLVSGIAIWGTAAGAGPFSLESKNDSLVLLQTFTGVVSLTMLILASASLERRKAIETLHQRIDDLASLSDSSRTFLSNYEAGDIYRTICTLAVTQLGFDAAWLEISDRDRKPVAVHGIGKDGVQRVIKYFNQCPITSTTNDVIIKSANKESTQGQAYHHHAAIPITFGGKIIAILNVVSTNSVFISEGRLPFVQSFANLCAVALQNTWLFGEVKTSNKQLHALSQHLISSQEKERLHLSREIHDESGQLLSALTVQLGLLERDIRMGENTEGRLIDLKRTANSIQNSLHALAINLRPTSLDHLGLVTALQQHTEDFTRQYSIDVKFEAIGIQHERLSEAVETAIFRIVQESLTNVVLHADASRVDVLIYFRNNHVVAIIEDDGIGYAPTSPTLETHLGILGMRERVEMLKGSFTIESSQGNGTTVCVEVPIDN